jgi:hypothetical protein
MNSEDDFPEADEAPGAKTETTGSGTATPQPSVGETLSATRKRRRLSLADIAAETRIPKRHLETIEAGRFEDLPSRTYAIGFSRNYARAVNLDERAIADRVREEMGAAGPRHSSVGQGMEPGDPAKLPSRGLALFGGIAALILLLGVITYASTYYGAGAGPAALTGPGEAGGAGLAEADADTPSSADDAFAASSAPSADGEVIFTALEDGVWVRFYEAGGERLFEAQMESGESFALPPTAKEPRINTGRPDAFAITIGGREVPKLAEEPVTMGDTPISAAALLARPEA